MTARARLRAGVKRAILAVDRLVFPEASGPADHWQRIVLNRSIDEYLASLGPSALSAAEISGDAHAEKPWRDYTVLAYPEFDLCAPLSSDRTYDVVICEQVLEHVVDPCAAVDNLRDLCRPGGHVVVSTPFLIKIHELGLAGIEDYWRFTPRGMRLLLERSGLDVGRIETWGNRECVIGNFNRWSRRRPWHSLRNESEFPVQIWAFARRPEDAATG